MKNIATKFAPGLIALAFGLPAIAQSVPSATQQQSQDLRWNATLVDMKSPLMIGSENEYRDPYAPY